MEMNKKALDDSELEAVSGGVLPQELIPKKYRVKVKFQGTTQYTEWKNSQADALTAGYILVGQMTNNGMVCGTISTELESEETIKAPKKLAFR